MERLARQDRRSDVVIADRQGFVVAGSGEHNEALAAFGALLLETGERARAALPLGLLEQVSVRDAQQVSVAVRPLHAASPDLLLATLDLARLHSLSHERK